MSNDLLLKLHGRIREASAASRDGFTSMSGEKRAEYHHAANRASHAKARAARAGGDLEPTAAVVRDLLADAALMILATDAPGAAQVRTVLAAAFSAKPGIPLKVETLARSGRLKLRYARLQDAR